MQNLSAGELTAHDRLESGGIPLRVTPADLDVGTAVLWSIRPERVSFASRGPYRATVVDAVDLGTTVELLLRLGDGLELRARPRTAVHAEWGEQLWIDLPTDAINVWPAATANDGTSTTGPTRRDARPAGTPLA
jgi:hypothetical protein